ncbi:hypothetical protein A2316_01905 [Candidatus Falkowbacteria bacterium RIFOXYB2_FULL_38_15]|uniref:Uncharacterized protein n=1 Tax=Candidatus Falkowbacteria bacterium RIFOXYA2_FULL_38_12 TaxID=1797993 RepID=A0A1F5S498_9BACT|nr:MAG: hypothetical protein A2257_03725 [Candidatus Falkowbacteria bacterium RIFOXYA2_FULL_38_12]OGF33115.1 MAG: hypothetical protein A2316_01905 [Candidatus Falkowbacteria bacterium RIFOXYB2_FULL_38_15]OGF43956.1 MAG: hypothetical protein A2555_02335 [Candidatus Falkowbacteria bacterium RIFOXYD2_FULL_39_16]
MNKKYSVGNLFLRRIIKFSFLLLIVVGFVVIAYPSSASAATYYVAKTGNDTTGDGSSGNPWLTLQKAEDTASNGDTVYANEGTYKENEAAIHGWRPLKGITWIASGTVTVHGTAPGTRVLYSSGTAAASFTGFTIDANDGVDGAKTYAANFAAGTTNKTFVNCIFKDAATSLFAGSTMSGFSVSGSTFEMATANMTGASGSFASSTFSGNTFNVTNGLAAVRAGTAGSSVIFDNNDFNVTSATYIWYVTTSGDYTITNNTFDTVSLTTSGMSFSTGSGTITIEDNDFTHADDSSIISITGDSWSVGVADNSFTSTIAGVARSLC